MNMSSYWPVSGSFDLVSYIIAALNARKSLLLLRRYEVRVDMFVALLARKGLLAEGEKNCSGAGLG